MKRKILLSIFAVVILLIGLAAWELFGPTVHAPKKKYFYISTGETLESVTAHLKDSALIGGTMWYNIAKKIVGLKEVKPGRYEISKGTSMLTLVRMLKNGSQAPVNFVITKLRTRENLASRTGKNFECDSTSMIRFLNNKDSLASYDLDTASAMAAVMPLTYTIKWNTTPRKIFDQFYLAYTTFWTPDRKRKADSLHLTPVQVSTIASIIDEETNAEEDRPKIASVYLNRISKGMPLQADPTLKYAMRNFGLQRIYDIHKQVVSPYNTYANAGLPPGPICTPMLETIDAVLDSPKTDYLFFVASSSLDGSSVFTSNLTDHMKYARLYQQELNKRKIK